PWLGGDLVNPSCRISRNLLRIELAECAAVAIAFLEHDRPAQACLRGFENEEFEMGTVIVGWHAPFAIVILAHQRIVDIHPGAPFRLRTRHVVALTAWLPPVRQIPRDRTPCRRCRTRLRPLR